MTFAVFSYDHSSILAKSVRACAQNEVLPLLQNFHIYFPGIVN